MLIDIGANLTHDSFDDDREEVIRSARAAGVRHMIVTGASLTGSEQALNLASRCEHLSSTAGIHPHHADETCTDVMNGLSRLAVQDKVVAIGETGLDYFRDFSPRPVQISSFEKHIELAIDLGMPMFLHERDAWPDFADILKPYRDRLGNVVVHCFTGQREALHAYLDLDCHIGITGWICDERRGTHLAPLIHDIPEDRLMIETDAPYLLPRTMKIRSRRNEPRFLPVIADYIAGLLQVSPEEIAHRTSRNAIRFFELP